MDIDLISRWSEFIDYCDRLKILLMVFPPHSTHTLQPLDVGLFKPLSTRFTPSHKPTTPTDIPIQLHSHAAPVNTSPDFISSTGTLAYFLLPMTNNGNLP